MTGRPPWRRAEPAQLLRYVATGGLGTVLPPDVRLPGWSGAPPEVRLRQLFAAFAAADVRYADEEPGAAGEQEIRPPDQVFVRPGRANCLDLAVAFAGGCLDAGLHAMIVTLSPTTGRARHAIVVVWLRDNVGAATYPLAAVVHDRAPDWPGMGLRRTWDEPGEFVAVDVTQIARGWPDDDADADLDTAVATAAAMLTDGSWTWDVGVDVGLGHSQEETYPLPNRPGVAPVDPPYHLHARTDTDSPLESVRARNRIVPFEPRGVLEALQDWCLAPGADPGRIHLALLHGVGGAGKTRVAAELAQRLTDEEGWYAGFLRRELTRAGAGTDDVEWLTSVVGPALVVVDYVEQADPATLAEQLKVLAGRRGRTVVLLTARVRGEWRSLLNKELGSRGVVLEASLPDMRLDALHPHAEAVYRRAYRRFSPATGAPDTAPDLPAGSARWTTLDIVMTGWLMARAPEIGLPGDRTALYEDILDREFVNWNAYLRNRYGREADEAALRRAATVVSLLSPAPAKAVDVLSAAAMSELTSLALGEVAGMLGRFLADDEGVLALRPDPLADHLMATDLQPDARFDRCVDTAIRSDGDEPDLAAAVRLVENLTRAADCGPDRTRLLAGRVLTRHSELWPVALSAAWTRGGPFVGPLEELARRDDTPLPLAQLAEQVPMGHGSLRTVALIAAERVTRRNEVDVTDDETLNRFASALNNLSARRAEAGDRSGALTSATEAVTKYRELATVNPAAFLPSLATSLNNLSNRQRDIGDRAGALASITEAVALRRELATANPAAFLPDLATSLINLGVQQSDTGDRVGALPSITEAVAIRRELATADPAAFLPDLALSLNNLSNRQSDAGDRVGALASITEAVAIRRELAAPTPAAFLPDLALSLNNLSNRQRDAGDRVGALASITEAVAIRRELATANPTAFLPDLAISLNNLSLRQGDTGDRVGALASITESVAAFRELAAATPAAFLPNLAMSLNNLSNRQSDAGERAGALASITEAVATCRQLVAATPAAFLPDLAMSLNNLSSRQAAAGDRAGALVSITEAVAIRRELAAATPAGFLPNLAASLNNLSNRQADAGDRAGALVSITEAVAIRRELAAATPAGFLPNLAASLNNLSNRQADAGDRAGALVSITEAVATFRELASATPAAFLPNLAASLNNLSNRQSDAGDRAGALDSIIEAVATYRELGTATPATFLPNLATSLNNLSLRQSDAGDRTAALTSINEAVTTNRELATASPAFLPNLATSLNNLSLRQSDAGDPAGALDSITEAVATHRELATATPAAYLPNLAMSLNNLSNRQADAGDRTGALASITEAVATYRELTTANPAAFLPNLATSLNNLSLQQRDAGDRTGALASITAAVATYRELTTANPAAFLPNLATSLNNLSLQQYDAGDRAGALASITAAVATYRELATANPAAFLPNLATSISVETTLRTAAEPRRDATFSASSLWDEAAAGLPEPSRASLLVSRSEWHRNTGHETEALADLVAAARLADRTDSVADRVQLSLARQHVRAAFAALDRCGDAADQFPAWATVPLPDDLIDLANAWIAGGWPERRTILTDPNSSGDIGALRVLATVYCDRPALQEWLDLRAAVDVDGEDAVVAALDAAQATMCLVTAWITTPSWNASQTFLATHPELRRPEVHSVLERSADDPVARQHLAVLRLVDRVPPGAVFDAIIDPGDARELLLAVARRGDAQAVGEVRFAVPGIAADPVTEYLAVALFIAFGDDADTKLDDIDEAAGAAADGASARDRRDVLALLAGLSRTRDDRSTALGRISAAFSSRTPT